MTTTTTPEERAALRQWYGAELAPKMEALFGSASEEAYRVIFTLTGPAFERAAEAPKRAARRAASAIAYRAHRAREAAEVAD